MSDENDQLEFLYNSALNYQSTNPALSRHLITRYIHLSQSLKIPFTIQKTYCHCCGSLFTTSNTTVSTVDKVEMKTILVNTKPVKDKIVEHILTQCHVCLTYTQFYSLSEKNKLNDKKKAVVKKKKVTLAGLVSKKTEQGFTLNDFISDI